MNTQQEAALALLASLSADGRQRVRYDTTLGSSAEKRPTSQRPSEWDGGWCEGWAFPLLDGRVDDIDLRVRKRMVNKKPVLEWGQGSNFSFTHGNIYSPREAALTPWLKYADGAVTCIEIQKGEPAKAGTPREHGKIEFRILKNTPGLTDFSETDHIFTTQDDFVRFLITGDRSAIRELAERSFVGTSVDTSDDEEDRAAERELFL